MKVSYEQEERFFEYIEKHLNLQHIPTARVVSILNEDDSILAVFYYSAFNGYGCEMRVFSENPRWCSKRVLNAIFDYPFNQLGCRRVLAATDSENYHSNEFLLRLGFKLEGILRFWEGEKHAMLYGMLREECRWI